MYKKIMLIACLFSYTGNVNSINPKNDEFNIEDEFIDVAKHFDFKWNIKYYNSSAVFNLFQCSYNNRLPTYTFDENLQKRFFDEHWTASEATYSNVYDDIVPSYHFKKQFKDDFIVITNTAHDLEENASESKQRESGNLSLEKIIGSVLSDANFKGKKTDIFIPLAESRKYQILMKSFERAHYTLLHIHKTEKNMINVNLYDSKGKSSSYYNLDHILKIFKKFHKENYYNDFTIYYLGQQGMMNNSDCGHYVINYIDTFVNSGKLPYQLSSSVIRSDIEERPVVKNDNVKGGDVKEESDEEMLYFDDF